MLSRLLIGIGAALAGLLPVAAAAQDSMNSSDKSVQIVRRLERLRVIGSNFETASGRVVVLRGVNIGGWLVTEAWMCGFADSRDTADQSGTAGLWGRSTLDSLEERFGASAAATLTGAWQDHWITTRDLDRIRDGGFNLIRVPISYRTLQHADGSWILDARGQIDFSRMDWIVREAASRGIYTIFDLHVWPEQRVAHEKIGRPDGAAIRAAMARLWTTIAAHYRGNGAIAAFDLINEFPGNWGVQQVLSQAVRKGDPKRVQVIEGFTFPEYLKLHQAGVFPNSVFSDHFYGADPLTTEDIAQRLKATANSPVPVYIGEFLAADFAAATEIMNQANASWSSWTYKTVDMGDWGTFNYSPASKTDIQNDAYQTILNNWSGLSKWQNNQTNKDYYLNSKRMPEPTADIELAMSSVAEVN